jgi:hypothetical protein
MSSSGQIDPYEELRHGHGRDRDVVIVGDCVLQTPPTPLGRNEDGGVQDQSFQPRSSVSNIDPMAASSRSHLASGRLPSRRSSTSHRGRANSAEADIEFGIELGREIPLAGPSPVLGSERWRISRASSTG